MPELADFDPTSGHLHGCAKTRNPTYACGSDCAGHLYVIAQDAERSLVEMRPVILTDAERQIVRGAGQLWNQICAAVPDGPTRASDLEELVVPIHLIQRYFMGQAAVRAYPGEFRGLGDSLTNPNGDD